MSHDITKAGQSPFDDARRIDDQGNEYWSARDLMPLMGYGADWRNLGTAIDRAKATAQNIGHDVDSLFVAVTEKSGGRPREDFRLARLAAYLVAMNGDPRKPETAAAQAYFAIRTREAEVAAATPALPQNYEEALEHLLVAVRENKALERKIAHDAPKLEAYDEFLNGSGCYQVATSANLLDIKIKTFWNWLYTSKLLIAKGSRRRQPYANPKTRSWFEVKTHSMDRTNGHAVATTYITAYGLDQIRQRLIAEGLIESQLFALPSPKQVAA